MLRTITALAIYAAIGMGTTFVCYLRYWKGPSAIAAGLIWPYIYLGVVVRMFIAIFAKLGKVHIGISKIRVGFSDLFSGNHVERYEDG